MNIFTQIKEVLRSLFGKKDIEDKIGAKIAVSQDMLSAIKTWSDCYENKAEWLTSEYKGKHLPSAVAHEIARLVTLEFKSELTGGAAAEYLAAPYGRIISDAATFTEYACAKGGLMFKPYISDGSIHTSYVQADSFFPTEYSSNGEITGCAFVERKVIGKKYYTRLETHSYSPSNYTVSNRAFLSDNSSQLGRSVSLGSIPEWAELSEDITLTGFRRPLFCYFKMPGANHIDGDSPLGVSVFANALDAIRDADEQYARFLWEFEGSELAIYADSTALKNDDNGGYAAPKHNKRLLRGIDITDLYQEFSPNIRDQAQINGLNEILRDVEFLSGLAFGTISRVEDTAKTATEIKSSRQRSYCTISAIQRALQNALSELLICFEDLCSFYNLCPVDKTEQSFEFDDSLITDSETEQRIYLQEVAAGLMRPEEYRMRRYGETMEQALKMLPDSFGGDE